MLSEFLQLWLRSQTLSSIALYEQNKLKMNKEFSELY